MKKANNFLKLKCADIEQILIKKNFENLNNEQKKSLENHLLSCEDCQKYQRILSNLKYSMKIDAKEKMQPDPKIRQTVITQINKSKASSQSIISKLFQNIWKFLDYRIPVYQGIMSFAAIVLIFFALNNFPSWDNRNSTETVENFKTEQTTAVHVNILNSLQIIDEQKIGKSAKEDTILTHFLYSSM